MSTVHQHQYEKCLRYLEGESVLVVTGFFFALILAVDTFGCELRDKLCLVIALSTITLLEATQISKRWTLEEMDRVPPDFHTNTTI